MFMPILSRDYSHEKDFQTVMSFLRDAYKKTKSLENWLPPRFENSAHEMADMTHLWVEVKNGIESGIVAMANPEKKFRYFIQVHPDYTFLVKEIIKWIEKKCKTLSAGEPYSISIVVLDGNSGREEILEESGFEKGEVYSTPKTRKLDTPNPDFPVPLGYYIRSVDPYKDFEELASAIRIVFGHGEWFTRDILDGLSKAAFYQRDLNLLALDNSDKIASFCTFRYDPPSRIVELEPMGTLPDHRRRGLGKALICEGLRRLEKYNPTLLFLEAANNPAAKRLYAATDFKGDNPYVFWNKRIT
jgi:GNAT superfamily N-acetyltransferase